MKLGIHRSVCGQLRLGIPSDGTAQLVGDVAQGAGRAGAVADFHGYDWIFSLADAVDKVDVVGVKAKILRLFP